MALRRCRPTDRAPTPDRQPPTRENQDVGCGESNRSPRRYYINLGSARQIVWKVCRQKRQPLQHALLRRSELPGKFSGKDQVEIGQDFLRTYVLRSGYDVAA